MARSHVVRGAAATILALPFVALIPALPASAEPGGTIEPQASDMRALDQEKAKSYKLDAGPSTKARKSAAATAAAGTPAVGTVRQWLALDDAQGRYYLKDYTLRGVGDKIEVWVANDTAYPEGDCRNPTGATVVTDQQVNDLVVEFDTNMFPKETAAFSTPPDRDGTNATIDGDFTGDGDKTVTLVDNVRDDNFYDFPAASTYIAGFFSTAINNYTDRNVMTIDAFDWAHRTGANPPNEVTDDPCTSRPARPRAYEGTFAHEWQHLLLSYVDPDELTWVDEGLADYAQYLVGYSNTAATVYEPGQDVHLVCFQGFGPVQTDYNNPRDCGGPENSLNLWGESPNPAAVLADYGNAYEFMQFLHDRYGADFLTALHRDADLQGLASVAALAKKEGVKDVHDLIHDYQSMVLLDKVVGGRWGVSLGVPKNRVTSASLNSTVNLANPASYATPGAAPNGADYVLLQDRNGKALKGRDLRSVQFSGAKTLPTEPLEWTVVTDDPDRSGNPVLFSGNANNTDAAAIFETTVPAADPTLSFLAKYGAEIDYDYGYVSVSTDGGKTYTVIPGDKTVDAPLGPGLNGHTDGFQPHSYDLSAYAGQTVLINIRYVSDGGVNEGGLLVDDVTVGGTLISDGSSLDPFDSPSEVSPTPVANWNVKLIGIDEKLGVSWQFEYDGKNSLKLGQLSTLLLAAFPKVVAVVAYDEPTEQIQQYAPYTLTVNGVLQPGGAPLP
ncbi:immune inhibitor A domain-containing protein [Catenuloplanes atrovinosus]|uniref:Peptidase M6 immune inhibitor A n=1 Tax=Catenuloplanes atrovinosus TaxID=137266 RepID=A0AAE4CDM6_9ACTN|nr:immune inhibitor A domain-containing protein [Catenuloplanes atrovinosus]MDR7279209.1 hypothetical protein [Catenuloplanes atrovinosus]